MMAVIANEVKRSPVPSRLPWSLRLPRNDGIHTDFLRTYVFLVLGDQRQDIVDALALTTLGNNRSVCICVHLW